MTKIDTKTVMKTALMAALSLGALGTALAQTPPQVAQSAQAPLQAFTHPGQVSNDLGRISATLNATSSFSGRFAQYAPDGSFSQGTVFLKRPGKIRFEYDAPAPLLLVSDGVTLTQVDKELDTKDRVPLKSTPLAFFLAENVNLENDVEVVSLQKTVSGIAVTAKDGSGAVDGAITMVFDNGTLALKEWIIHDDFGQQTRVILSDIKYNERLNPRLFILRDEPRGRRR